MYTNFKKKKIYIEHFNYKTKTKNSVQLPLEFSRTRVKVHTNDTTHTQTYFEATSSFGFKETQDENRKLF